MKCALCGKEFDPLIVGRKKYCSDDCAKEAQYFQTKANKIKYKECEFVARSTDRRKGHTQSKQICWTCQNACGGCSWSSELKPVICRFCAQPSAFLPPEGNNPHPRVSDVLVDA